MPVPGIPIAVMPEAVMHVSVVFAIIWMIVVRACLRILAER